MAVLLFGATRVVAFPLAENLFNAPRVKWESYEGFGDWDLANREGHFCQRDGVDRQVAQGATISGRQGHQ